MKKKLLVTVLSLVCVIVCAFGLVACDRNNEPPAHTHTYSEEWQSDANNHWHAATCEHTDEKGDVAAHVDANNDGKCDICEYEPITVKVGGTYYFCEDDITDDLIYIVFHQTGKWTDDENNSGEYTVFGNTVTLYITVEGEKIEFASGTVNGDDIILDLGADVTYRKGEDIGNKPQEKTLQYALSEDRTYYVVKGIGGLTGEIEIPDEWKRKPVKEIAENAFANCKDLTNITIGANVETIGKKAFYKCANLTNAILGEKIETIFESTFEDCRKLESITIPATVKSIEKHAFTCCLALKDVHYTGTASKWAQIDFYYDFNSRDAQVSNPLSDNNIYIVGNNTANADYRSRNFYIGGELASEIEITETATISPVAFRNYKGLKTLTIGGSVTVIEEYAFSDCEELQTLRFTGNSLKTIGKAAFSGCEKLSAVSIPNSVNKIEQSAFNECRNLVNVKTGDGVVYLGDGSFMGCEQLTMLTLGNSVSEICEVAFYNCGSLTSVTIPESTIYIGKEAFFGTSITAATFENKQGWQVLTAGGNKDVENLEDTAHAATLLKNSILMNGYSDYEWEKQTLKYTLSSDKTYYTVSNNGTGCRSEIVIPSTYNGKPVKVLAKSAFYNCSNLTKITIPASVTSIGNYAFEGCNKLETIKYTGDIASWCGINGCNYLYLSKVYIDNQKLQEMTTIIIPDSVTSIGSYAFSGCSKLTSIAIPDSVTSIGYSAFSGCSSLTSITIPDSVTSIGYSAFYGCSSLTSITIPNSVTSIGSEAFYDCSSLTSITIPDSVTSIGNSAFYGCSNLTSITIPNSVTSIGSEAFKYCSSLTSIIIPDSVTSIGRNAFDGCRSLTSITFNGTKEEWKAIEKGGYWNNRTGNYTVHCTDGDIAKSEDK